VGQAEDPCTRPVPGNPGNECAAYGRGHGVPEPDDVGRTLHRNGPRALAKRRAGVTETGESGDLPSAADRGEGNSGTRLSSDESVPIRRSTVTAGVPAPLTILAVGIAVAGQPANHGFPNPSATLWRSRRNSGWATSINA
jgi:hypothetical protein